MKLQFIEKNSDYESESDYDTAIDMSHWTRNSFEYVFKTDRKVLITFFGNEEATSYSSHDENDDEDGPMYKSSRSSSGENKVVNDYSLLIFLENEIKATSAETFKEKIISRDGFNEYENYIHNKYSEIHSNLDNFNIPMDDEELDIINKYKNVQKFKKLDFYDLPLSEEAINAIIKFEDKNSLIVEKNIITKASNFENMQLAQDIIYMDSLKDKTIINKQLFNLIIEQNDSPEIAKKIVDLMKKGADFSLENDIGDNAFMVACRKNMKNITNSIFDETLKYNKDFIVNNLYFDINKANLEGDTALIFIAKKGNKNLLDSILNEYEDIDVYHVNKFGKDAIKTSIEFNNAFVLEAIIKYADKYELKQVEQNKISYKKI
ncbi:MAG: hypothetical protein H7263_13325 [Candidatus Sericytochromatia bacterium]|nr:hypothetical protein [Candidatus Sericytochromatia bacterium]